MKPPYVKNLVANILLFIQYHPPSELAVVCVLLIVLVWQDPSKALTSLSFVMLLAAPEADWGRRT